MRITQIIGAFAVATLLAAGTIGQASAQDGAMMHRGMMHHRMTHHMMHRGMMMHGHMRGHMMHRGMMMHHNAM